MCRSVCISVNPFQWLPLYAAVVLGGRARPSAFATAQRACSRVAIGASQSILVSGVGLCMGKPLAVPHIHV